MATFIKPEPGSIQRRTSTRTSTTPRQYQQTVTSTLSVPQSDHRAHRSGAPSVLTRPDEGEENEVMFLETRVRTKTSRSESPSSESMSSRTRSGIVPIHALQDIGQKINKINDTLGQLQGLGIHHQVPQLPELVLIGDQSAGKSSLMSALAGLSLPRDSGTCTRCPLHIRTSRADEWSCEVRLHEDYRYVPREGRPISLREVTRNDPFPPWVRQPRQTTAFMTITDRNAYQEIENVLQWAQMAILNPTKMRDYYKRKATSSFANRLESDRQMEALFSPNTIALEVRGPDLAELSFYDLPGIIASAGVDDLRFLEKVVRNLAREFIQHPNAIILWAVPMNNDPQNSAAYSVICETRAQDRCVGVMTKADLLREGGEHSWLAMLKGDTHRTGLGYYITSRSSDPQEIPDLEKQTSREEAFFNRQLEDGTWSSAFEEYKDLCGVVNLHHFLSKKLAEEFAKVLPEVKATILAQLSDVEHELAQLPDVPLNAELEITQSLTRFNDRIKALLDSHDFNAVWDENAKLLSKKVINLKPRYIMRETRSLRPGPAAANANGVPVSASSSRTLNLEEDGLEMSSPVATPTSVRVRGIGSFGSKKRSAGNRDSQSFDESPTKLVKKEHPSTPSGSQRFQPRRPGPQAKTLEDLRDILTRLRRPGMPNVVSLAAIEQLTLEAIEPWRNPLQEFVTGTFQLLESRIMETLASSFCRLRNRAIYRECLNHISNFIHLRELVLRSQLEAIYNLESRRYYTLNDDIVKLHQENEMRMLLRVRHHQRWSIHRGEDPGPLAKIEDLRPDELQKEETRQAKETREMGPDKFDQEIELMARVRGYYLTAAARFVDIVCIHVASGLVPNLAGALDGYLRESLKLNYNAGQMPSKEVLDRLMREDEHIAEQRKVKLGEKDRFEQAIASIVQLEQEIGRDSTSQANTSHNVNSDVEMSDVSSNHSGETASGAGPSTISRLPPLSFNTQPGGRLASHVSNSEA